jgi:filamentous hemagglutinin
MSAQSSAPPPAEGDVHPDLLSLAAQFGGVGAQTSCGNTIGTCAEFHAVNDLLWRGSSLENIRLTPAIRPDTGNFVSPCANCYSMFSDQLHL